MNLRHPRLPSLVNITLGLVLLAVSWLRYHLQIRELEALLGTDLWTQPAGLDIVHELRTRSLIAAGLGVLLVSYGLLRTMRASQARPEARPEDEIVGGHDPSP